MLSLFISCCFINNENTYLYGFLVFKYLKKAVFSRQFHQVKNLLFLKSGYEYYIRRLLYVFFFWHLILRQNVLWIFHNRDRCNMWSRICDFKTLFLSGSSSKHTVLLCMVSYTYIRLAVGNTADRFQTYNGREPLKRLIRKLLVENLPPLWNHCTRQ